ncbi:hypothetical protein JCM12298_08050 [Desulfothermus naphthae]
MSPVTQVADVAVNKASTQDIGPFARLKSICNKKAPTIITRAKNIIGYAYGDNLKCIFIS